ncbi:pseudouridine synthase [Levilactobacillus acidifarinae]|uniref:Pseudouridine synthase n=1 Tax=Levilactobacillus acidifarinae DSM 19394 = JCM 15949 TaxID=1423715 RepID=A0A0R1LG39_9LACO|nr:pseudouridine synthase [Levilactobacillus acidifarinae]KRK94639.1 16S rRNA pseudouridylate synthase [Levilactobacillus acidifarinae DSM 19394]GEO68392.1 pseudouridine synthase [Levilactobacillus acidifarinae]
MERLQKVLAHAGVASRRQAEKLITSGHVRVNQTVVTELGTKVGVRDAITVDNVPITAEAPVYMLLYKPRGVVSTANDDKKRKTVVDLIDNVPQRIYPVGRLDYDTSGLLLLTNDGELANRLTHPRYEVEKTYVARVTGVPTNDALRQLRQGVTVDGEPYAPAKTKMLSYDQKKKTAIVQLTIHEGRNHQVKKMLAAVGFPVEKLKREQYGFLTLKGLQSGDSRHLKPEELKELKRLTGLAE